MRYMFFLASLMFLQLRFFCIISWSRPVITMVMKAPLRKCLKKWFSACQSPNTQILESLPAVTLPIISPRERSMERVIRMMETTTAVNMQKVCSVSVQMMVLMPLRNV